MFTESNGKKREKNFISHNAVRFLCYLAPFHLVPLESSSAVVVVVVCNNGGSRRRITSLGCSSNHKHLRHRSLPFPSSTMDVSEPVEDGETLSYRSGEG